PAPYVPQPIPDEKSPSPAASAPAPAPAPKAKKKKPQDLVKNNPIPTSAAPTESAVESLTPMRIMTKPLTKEDMQIRRDCHQDGRPECEFLVHEGRASPYWKKWDIHCPTCTNCNAFPRSRDPNDENETRFCHACWRNKLLWKAYKKYIGMDQLCMKWSLNDELLYMREYKPWDADLKDSFEPHVVPEVRRILREWRKMQNEWRNEFEQYSGDDDNYGIEEDEYGVTWYEDGLDAFDCYY